jgi:hypothetical protein
MAEIEITLPTVQFGNVKVRATPEELGLASLADAYDVGIASAVYLNVFTQGFKKGATLDVAERGEPSQGAPEHEYISEAHRLLDERLGGVTEVPEDYNDDGPGDVQAAANEARAPWDNPQVDAKPKPWETGSAAPAKLVVDEGW